MTESFPGSHHLNSHERSLAKQTPGLAVVIFDCDGVLFDSREANILFYNHLLETFGLPRLKPEDIAFVHAHTAEESIKHIFRGTPYVQAAQRFRLEIDYGPFIRAMVPEPGLQGLLERLKPLCRLAIATNRSNTISQVLETHRLARYFDMVVSSLDVTRPKPHPESLDRILKAFGVGTREAVYVGDSEVDQQTAKRAGVPFIAYRNPSLAAPFHAADMPQLEELLMNWSVISSDEA